ncbi:RNA polymerase sigma factor [Kitasatospora purpeofusca]|uniref:RNA polymerase sigma factor n=1 Tax=Kitasatospora purpeofusca TaxID=67352 RepID=UPI002250D964|nr:sigma-70 family RNA polymerase sigma factor [Kitasatospora purpeofusca]MCX4682718.1 sigma-70 family RNA polymerase sigma factor [Kitasatospora purpeofusca]MCX4690618.1 sigma-70 family RNA polymerase sigma factor [Kitasatospora purpeofusca]MCX4690800.1 sigma-70 family RNA polymerase sigma factor [Kitasatospora purpeofusca]
MSEPPFTDAAGTAAGIDLPIAFRGFQELHGQAYFDYAFTVLGDQRLAQELVDDVFLALADRWDRVLTDPNPHAFAWAALRRTVEAEQARDEEHRLLVERIAFAVVAYREEAKQLIDDIDAVTTDLEVGVSVATAVLELSGAKFDAVVLRYLNRFSVERTALAMGIDERTVRSLTSQAKARIRARLTPRRLLHPGPAKSDQE